MATGMNRLSARAVATLKKPGRHADGGNLFLSISPNGSKSWVFLYRFGKWPKGRELDASGKPKRGAPPREMGLGGAGKGKVTLAKARELASAARALLAQSKDPLAVRKAEEASTRVIPTFGTFADEYVKSHECGWRNAKHRRQWHTAITVHAAALRPLAINTIGTEEVLSVLRPIWETTPETASRLRGRIEAILNSAKTRGHRSGDNPAQWRGHLQTTLAAHKRLIRGHHPALDYHQMPEFMCVLRTREAIAARCLEFLIYTAARSGEALGAR